MMTFGSLFAGIGGIDLGFERAGLKCLWQIEKDQFCLKVLEEHFPEAERLGDIKEVDFGTLRAPDIICGGFPCQPVSAAGHKKGMDDPRWLWPYFRDAISTLEPRYAVLENVPGLLHRGHGFNSILGELANLGYDAEWESIPAAAFGHWHRRWRVYIVAYPSRQRLEKADVFRGVTPETCRKTEEEGKWSIGYIRGLSNRIRLVPEQSFSGVADGLSKRMVRDIYQSLGNAVVPDAAQWIAEQILRRENELSSI